MKTSRLKRAVRFAIPVLTAGIFFMDWLTPLGIVDWVLYFIPLLLSFYASARFSPILLAIVFSVLTGLGFYLSPPGLEPMLAMLNLLLGLGTLWVAAFLVARLRRSQRFLQSALDAISAHIAILNQQGLIVAVNSAWNRFARENNCLANNFGINADYLALCESAIGNGADEAPAVAQGIRSVMAGRCDEFLLEYPCHSPDEERWFAVRVTRFSGEGPMFVVVAHENITARKHVEEALERKTALLEAQVNSSIDGILVVDELGKKTLQNERLAELMKIPRSIANEKDDERQLQWVKQAAKNPESFIERVIYLNSHPDETSRDELEMKDGIILDRYSAPLLGKDGKYYGRLWTFRDITERKKAVETLREKEHMLSESQRLGHIGSWFGDLTGPLSWSEEAYCIYGVSPDTFLPTMESLLGLIHPDDRRALLNWQIRIAAGQTPGEVEFRIKRPDGTIRFIKRNGEAVYDADHQFIHMAGTVQDITERKQAQADRETLERRLAEHRASEERARLALEHEQKLSKVQSRFVNMVSHEFRTPLCVINMAVQLLDGYMNQMSSLERSEQLKEIQNSVERMTQMMNDFLIHGNCTSGTIEFKPAPLNLEALCRQIIMETPGHSGSAHPVEFSVDSAVREVWLDERIIRHILGNLLSNAVKYSLDGQPVALQVKCVGVASQLHGDTNGFPESQLEFKISDSGIGIPASDLTKLYDSFHRGANVGQRPGTGMGLAIVKQFVDLHRGTIRFASEEGKGTTVWVRLPITGPLVTVVPNEPNGLKGPGTEMAAPGNGDSFKN